MDNIKEKLKKFLSNIKNLVIVIEAVIIALLLGTTIGFISSTSSYHTSYNEEVTKVESYSSNEQILVTRIATLNGEVQEAKDDLDDLEDQLEDLQSQYETLEEDNEDLEAQIANLQTQISEKTTQITNLQSQITDLQSQLAAMTAAANKFSVFYIYNDEVVDTQIVDKNGTPTEPSTPVVQNKFTAWETAKNITEDTVVFLEQYDATVEFSGSALPNETLVASLNPEVQNFVLTYAWYKIDSENQETLLTSATSNSLSLTTSDIGYKYRVEVTAKGFSGKGEETSDEVEYPITGIIGVLQGGATICSTIYTYVSCNADSYTLQWYSNGVAISGQTGDSYDCAIEDYDKDLKLVATPTDGHTGTLELDFGKVGKMPMETFVSNYISVQSSNFDILSFKYYYTFASDTTICVGKYELSPYISYKWFIGGVEVQGKNDNYLSLDSTSYLGKSLSVQLTGDTYIDGSKTISITDSIGESHLPDSVSIYLGNEGVIDYNYYLSSSYYDIEWYVDGTYYSSSSSLDLADASNIGKEVYAQLTGKNGYAGTLRSNKITVVHKIDGYCALNLDYSDFTNILSISDPYNIVQYCTVSWSCNGTTFSNETSVELPAQYSGQSITLTVVGDGTHVQGTYTESEVCTRAEPV